MDAEVSVESGSNPDTVEIVAQNTKEVENNISAKHDFANDEKEITKNGDHETLKIDCKMTVEEAEIEAISSAEIVNCASGLEAEPNIGDKISNNDIKDTLEVSQTDKKAEEITTMDVEKELCKKTEECKSKAVEEEVSKKIPSSNNVKIIEEVAIKPIHEETSTEIDDEPNFNEIQEFIDLVETGKYDNFQMQLSPVNVNEEVQKEETKVSIVSGKIRELKGKVNSTTVETMDFIPLLSDDDDEPSSSNDTHTSNSNSKESELSTTKHEECLMEVDSENLPTKIMSESSKTQKHEPSLIKETLLTIDLEAQPATEPESTINDCDTSKTQEPETRKTQETLEPCPTINSKSTSFLHVHDVAFNENENETEKFDENTSLNVLDMNISKIDDSNGADDTIFVIDIPNYDDKPASVFTIEDDDDEGAASSTLFSDEKNTKETQETEIEQSEMKDLKEDDVVLIPKEIPVVVLDSDSEEEGQNNKKKNLEDEQKSDPESSSAIEQPKSHPSPSPVTKSVVKPVVLVESDSDGEDVRKREIKKEVKAEPKPSPTLERPSSRHSRHPPPVAVNTVDGVKTDFTVVRSKPVKTKLVIQRNLGDVLFDPEEIKRVKKEKMKEYLRLKEIEREINNQKFRKPQQTKISPNKKTEELLLNPFALKQKEPKRSFPLVSEYDKPSRKKEISPNKKLPMKSFDLTDDEPVITSDSISKNLSKIRESVTAAKRSQHPISHTNLPPNTNPPLAGTSQRKPKKSRFSSPTFPKAGVIEPPKFNTISVFDIINDVNKEILSSRSRSPRRRGRSPSPKRKINRDERFGDRPSSRSTTRPPTPPYMRGGRKRSPSPRTEYQMTARRIERNISEHNTRNDVDFRDMRFSVRNDLSAQERQSINEREQRGSIFNRLGGSSSHHLPSSPPRGAFRDDVFSRRERMEDINMRDFPMRDFPVRESRTRDNYPPIREIRDDFPMRENRDNFPPIREIRDDFQMRDDFPPRNRDPFEMRNNIRDRDDFRDRNTSLDNNFPQRMNNNVDPYDRDRRQLPPRNDFDSRNHSMFTVSNPRKVDERNFMMPSPPRMVPPPDFDSDNRNRHDNGRPSVFNRLQSSSRIHSNDSSGGYWEQGGNVPGPTRTPSPPPPPIYNPEDHYNVEPNNIKNDNISQHFASDLPPVDWQSLPKIRPPSTMVVDVRQPVTSSVLNFEEEDFLLMISCEDEKSFLTSQNCSQILDHLEMLSSFEFKNTAYKDECLFIRTTRSKGEWVLKVVKTSNLRSCPKLTGEVCLGALPSSEPYQVSVKIISSLMNNPLKASNFFDIVELIQNLLAQHPRYCRVVKQSNITFYRNSVNIDCYQDLDTAKQLKDIISTIRTEGKNCPKLAAYVDGDLIDVIMTLDAQLKKVGVIMNSIRSTYTDMNVNAWIITSVNFSTGLFHMKIPVRDATLICRENLLLNIKWHPNGRGRLVFEFLDKRIEKRILISLRN
ncbi:hypothetical protein ACFFRR_011507 [Megaselia abdita]